MKRIIPLLTVGAAVTALFFVFSPFAGARSSTAQVTTVRVTAKEYKFILSRSSAPHGKVTFKLTNKGALKHDFKIAGKKTPQIGHGKTATLTVTLKKGKFPYICTVDSHAKFGMKGTFKAT
jgi:uncharacterized cupredoxin-like copper-binding protein